MLWSAASVSSTFSRRYIPQTSFTKLTVTVQALAFQILIYMPTLCVNVSWMPLKDANKG